MVDLDDMERSAHAAPLGGSMQVDAEKMLELVVELRAARGALRIVARSVVRALDASGQVMTVEQRSLQPLAMGNTMADISFRPKHARGDE